MDLCRRSEIRRVDADWDLVDRPITRIPGVCTRRIVSRHRQLLHRSGLSARPCSEQDLYTTVKDISYELALRLPQAGRNPGWQPADISGGIDHEVARCLSLCRHGLSRG